MFGLFKKKHPPSSEDRKDSSLVRLCGIYDELNDDISELYSGFENHNPAELRFFTMSAVSVFLQSLGNLSEGEMRSLVEKFTEQCVAMLLFHMPKAEYSQVHSAFIARFPTYPDLIVDVFNAQTTESLQESTFALISTMDLYILADRHAFDVSIAGLKIGAILSDLAINVRKAITSA